MVEKACAMASIVVGVLTVLGVLATMFLLANGVWAGAAVYANFTILYGYLTISFWSGTQHYEISWW